ncbi:prolyl 3-hydroxylase 2 isoform X2 [Echeneis naucrates]|uniref:procollagen-proline 3-dioxygenase n=1 Tax=Echeneis naucrates TaxID=173247 RepID=A0A665WN19_ECHNA|nr:prolyl 3-hydroxylase 2 isoform X2 [Echeneis naucrates]
MDGHRPPAAVLSVVLLAVLLPPSAASLEPFDRLYEDAVRAFYGGDFGGVVRLMEGALGSYAEVRRTKVRCRLRCQDRHPFPRTFSDLRFFDVVLRRAACMDGCIGDKLGTQSVHRVSQDVVQDFNRRIPYNYLQLAYQKLKQPDKAASAAHTYFQANPEHVEMGQNLEQYKDLQGVEEKHFVDREARAHQHSFTAAVRLYDSGDYEGAIALFEDALAEYYKADVECRALCQGPQRFEGHDHLRYRYSLHELVSDHFTQVLHCEHECVRDLATRPGRLSPMENYLPLHYDYLQFAYFQVDRLEEALQCALTYLLFHEGEEFMTDNVDYYREVLGRSGEPREKAAWYLRRHRQELELLLIGSKTMGVEFTEGNYWSSTGGRDDSNRIPSGTDGWMEYVPISEKRNVSVAAPQKLNEGGPLVYESVQLVQNSAALNGSQRVLLDHVLSEEECAELRHLAHVVTMAGDGYRGRMSPHTPNEKFEGATVLKTLQYGYEGRVPMRSARLFYDISERARRIVESYFLLNSTLHFSYTHLVCRTAITGQQDHRNDLSHPIHADNCLLDPEANECWKEPPAYTYRDYSALLYLNGDFEGGEFIFTEMDAKTITASVKPRCGRMVGFSSGGENPHGVKAVTGGQRCAVALWFTLDPLFRELERLQADEVIQALDTQSVWGQSLHINPKDEL